MTVSDFVGRLEGAKQMGKGWIARCPAHPDRNPSLKIDEGRDGRVLLKCHTGCDPRAIVTALGLTLSDLYPDQPNGNGHHPDAGVHPHGYRVDGRGAVAVVETEQSSDNTTDWRPVAEYVYHAYDGEPAVKVERREPAVQLEGKRRKRFVQFRWNGSGWLPGLEGVVHKPLYRLPELTDALADSREVLIVEGEKDCDTAASLGYSATTNLGGSGGWRPEYASLFTGASVLILPDNDRPGHKWAEAVGSACVLHGASVRMAAVPLDREGADLTDWVQSGATREDVDRLVARARAWKPGDPIPAPPKPSRFRVYSPSDLETLSDLKWLAHGIFPMRSMLCLTGAPGCGKSFVALALALSIATGEPWLGTEVHKGPILYVAGEGGVGFKKRVAAWCEMYGADPAATPAHFILEAANLFGTDDVTHVLRACEALPSAPALVVFDTLHRSMTGGDENSAQDMGMVLARADRIKHETDASVLFVHHNRKDGDVERGSIAIRGAVDTLAMVKGEEDGPRTLSCEKQKDFDEFTPVQFVLTPQRDSCVVTLYDSALDDRPERLTSKRRAALATLVQVFGGSRGATSTEWQEASGLPRSTFYNVRAWLVRHRYASELTMGNSARYVTTEAGKWAVANPSMTGIQTVPG